VGAFSRGGGTEAEDDSTVEESAAGAGASAGVVSVACESRGPAAGRSAPGAMGAPCPVVREDPSGAGREAASGIAGEAGRVGCTPLGVSTGPGRDGRGCGLFAAALLAGEPAAGTAAEMASVVAAVRGTPLGVLAVAPLDPAADAAALGTAAVTAAAVTVATVTAAGTVGASGVDAPSPPSCMVDGVTAFARPAPGSAFGAAAAAPDAPDADGCADADAPDADGCDDPDASTPAGCADPGASSVASFWETVAAPCRTGCGPASPPSVRGTASTAPWRNAPNVSPDRVPALAARAGPAGATVAAPGADATAAGLTAILPE